MDWSRLYRRRPGMSRSETDPGRPWLDTRRPAPDNRRALGPHALARGATIVWIVNARGATGRGVSIWQGRGIAHGGCP